MVKNNFTLLLLLLFTLPVLAASSNYIVYFKDKKSDKNLPENFTKEGVKYRAQHNIPFDSRDYPINDEYLQQIYRYNVVIKNQSNWLNAILIQAEQHTIKKIKNLSFVQKITIVNKTAKTGITAETSINNCASTQAVNTFEDNYTASFEQVNLLHGNYLHEQGFRGENMIIAICDNGFQNLNNNPAFSHLFAGQKVLGTYNYVTGDSAVFSSGNGVHGSNCLSFIAGKKENEYVGTATNASFYLFHTEDDNGEQLAEEFNLAAALERCSQLGVQVVSISLGYSTFDNTSDNHDTLDMKKNNTPAAVAVNIAASKGILVCVSAGNEGNKAWHYITTPADADSAFTVASVDLNGTPDATSGWGLAGDTRIKPNIAAAGKSVKFINANGNVSVGSGTSYATPQIAGLSACLWQAFPTKTNWEIKTAIEKSASQYLTPDKKIGYGIPDFQKAYTLLATPTYVSHFFLENEISIYPNPFRENVYINLQQELLLKKIQMINTIGQVVYEAENPTIMSFSVNDIPKGIYFLQLETDKGLIIKKIIKE